MNITHGFQARMLLRTEIAQRLLDAGAELIVVAPNANEPYFRAEFDRPGFVLEPSPHRVGFFEQQIVGMRIYFLMNPALGATYNHKRDWFRRTYPVRARLARAINLVLGNIPLLRRAYLTVESKLFNGSEYDSLLERHRQDLVVAGTPGFGLRDAHLLRAAKRKGIPTATVMLSWDNLTSKGYMGAAPDYLLVWSDLMREEALHYHDFKGTIVEVGAAQFDIYTTARATFDIETFRRKHRNAKDKKLIVWGTISSELYPNQLELLQEFVDWLESSDSPYYLWVRVHPQSVHGAYGGLLDGYKSLAGPHVHVEIPPVLSEHLRWDLPAAEMEHLAHLLSAADVMITPQSTLTIDAACAGTPIINLAIDPNFAARIDDTHYKNITKHNGAWVVRSFDELVEAIDSYVEEAPLHKEGRAAIVTEQMGQWFGRAGERTSEVLLHLASAEAASSPQVERDSLSGVAGMTG